MAGFEAHKLFCFLFARFDLTGGKDAEPKVKSIPPGEGVSQEGVDKLKHRRDVPVANAIKLLQACIYRSVNTGLFLTTSVAISIL